MKYIFKRFVAFYIDLIIVSVIVFAISALIGIFPNKDKTIKVIDVMLIMCIGVVLFVFKDAFGCSFGKRIFKLRIIDRIQPSAKVSVGKLILRNILVGLWMIDVFLLYQGISKYKIMDKKLGLDVVPVGESTTTLKHKLPGTLR